MTNDVTMHNGKPSVNIKVHKGMDSLTFPLLLCYVDDKPLYTDEGFDFKWMAENLTDGVLSEYACITAEDCISRLIEEGVTIFHEAGYQVEIWQNGRSGGWLEVSGLEGFEDWDTDLQEAWSKFEEICEAEVDAFPQSVAHTIYLNEWEAQRDAKQEAFQARNERWAEVKDFLEDLPISEHSDEALMTSEELLLAFQAACPKVTERLEEE